MLLQLIIGTVIITVLITVKTQLYHRNSARHSAAIVQSLILRQPKAITAPTPDALIAITYRDTNQMLRKKSQRAAFKGKIQSSCHFTPVDQYTGKYNLRLARYDAVGWRLLHVVRAVNVVHALHVAHMLAPEIATRLTLF